MNTSWIEQYSLFLFDFDGLLVSTEHLHFKAYQNMVAAQGLHLPWTFADFCLHGHYSSDMLRCGIYHAAPELQTCGKSWDELYKEKKKEYMKLLQCNSVTLMLGVETLLPQLTIGGIKMCVVTHSPKEQIDAILLQIPLLQSIPHWITRHDYTRPKPDPECYELAIAKYASPQDKVIGFEDSPKGLKALQQTRAQAVLLSSIAYPDLEEIVLPSTWRYPDMQHMLEEKSVSAPFGN